MLSNFEFTVSTSFNSILSSAAALANVLSSSNLFAEQTMMERKAKVEDIKARIAKGQYRVSSELVAKSMRRSL